MNIKVKDMTLTCKQKCWIMQCITLLAITIKKWTDALTPSCYLDLCITKDQAKLLAPTVKDAVQGSIIENAMGEGAKKESARHRINMFEENIASYSCSINSKDFCFRLHQSTKWTREGSMSCSTDCWGSAIGDAQASSSRWIWGLKGTSILFSSSNS